METINLGDKVIDPVTGFTGTVTVISHYLSGLTRVGVEALDGDGKIRDEWFDIGRVNPAKPQ